ncbi:MAG TPA: hypothetical protein VHW01_10940 [Polyangiaceae bacterium]|jgi:hypothetical protein|nr:hypothetical protein [Polyangiaceae bacterium]
MAAALRILLWAIVLIAPGGILLAPLLAAHELRRRNRAERPSQAPATIASVRPSQVPATVAA